MQVIQEDTGGRLPAVTLPLPTPSRDTFANLRAVSPDATGVFRALDGSRWSSWGAARDGARVTFHRRQLMALAVIVALITLCIVVSPHDLAVGVVAIITAVYLVADTYKIWFLLR